MRDPFLFVLDRCGKIKSLPHFFPRSFNQSQLRLIFALIIFVMFALMNFVSVIILLGIAQGVFLGILLLAIDRGNKTANRLLGVLMIMFSISISGFEYARIGFVGGYPFYGAFASTVIFLFGPLFYYYVRALTENDFQLKSRCYLHLIPLITLIIYRLFSVPFYGSEKVNSFMTQSFDVEGTVIIFIQMVHLFIYIYYIKILLRQHLERIKNSLSSIDKINLRWVNLGINAFVFVFGLIACFSILFLAGINLVQIYVVVIPVLVSIIIVGLGFWGLQQPIIFPPEKETPKNKKYEKSSLTDERADEHSEELLLIMTEEKPYFEGDLTLQKLADRLSISPHHLSQIINDKIGQNFFDFINSYRIEEAKKLLLDPRGELLTILAISEETGFNSKSSFNNAFKKYTGQTPSQFKQEMLKKNNRSKI